MRIGEETMYATTYTDVCSNYALCHIICLCCRTVRSAYEMPSVILVISCSILL